MEKPNLLNAKFPLMRCILFVCLCFILISCPSDDDDDDVTPTSTPTEVLPTPTMTPLDHNDIFNFSVTEESDSTVYVSVDYYYTGDHGQAWMGALPLDLNGNWLYAGYVPVSLQTGYGSAEIKVQYFGAEPAESNTIEVSMYTSTQYFNIENFDYNKTWIAD